MITITTSSFKGGTAKTSSCLHLASGLAHYHNLRVLAVDFDAQANLTSGLGIDIDQYDSLAKVLLGEKELRSVIIKSPIKGLDIIPADIWLERVEVTGSLATDRYSHERLKNILNRVKDDYDVVFIDTPPSLSWLTESAMIASDYCLICANPEFYSVKGLERLSAFLEGMNKRHQLKPIGVCLSMWNPRGKNNRAFLEMINEFFPELSFNTKIRRDAAISEAAILGKPVYFTQPKSRGSQDYTLLTKELLDRLNQDLRQNSR